MRVHRLILCVVALAALLSLTCVAPADPTTNSNNIEIGFVPVGTAETIYWEIGDSLTLSAVLLLQDLVDSVVFDFDDGATGIVVIKSAQVGDTVTGGHRFTSEGARTVTVTEYPLDGSAAKSDTIDVIVYRKALSLTLFPALQVSYAGITVVWSQYPDSVFTAYKVHYATDSNVTAQSALAEFITDRSDTTCAISGLAPATRYFVRVFVYENTTLVGQSNVIDTVTSAVPPPQVAVTSISLVRDSGAIEPAALGITGTASSCLAIDSVTVQVNGAPVQVLGTTNWVIGVTQLEAAAWNRIDVHAVNAGGAVADYAFHVFRKPQLGQPGHVAFGPAGSSAIPMHWSPVTFCTGYRVYAGAADTAVALGVVAVTADTTFTDTGLTAGTTRRYAVRGFYEAPGGLGITDSTPLSPVDSCRTLIVFQKAFGDAADDGARYVAVGDDGRYMVVGEAKSFGVGYIDQWLLRMEENGDTAWSSLLGRSEQKVVAGIADVGNGRFAVGATFHCMSAMALPCPVPMVTGIDTGGSGLTSKSYFFFEHFTSARATGFAGAADGGGFLLATAQNFQADPEPPPYLFAARVNAAFDTIRTDSIGDFGMRLTTYGCVQVADGDFVALATQVPTMWVVGAFPPPKMVVFKFAGDGDTVLTWRYTGNRYTCGYAVAPCGDGGFVVSGESAITGADTVMFVSKFTAAFTEEWTKFLPVADGNFARSVRQTSDGGYVAAGSTSRAGAGGMDMNLVKLNAAGTVEWKRTFGGSGDDRGWDAQQTPDGGYIVVGETASFGNGMKDYYIVKTDGMGRTGADPE